MPLTIWNTPVINGIVPTVHDFAQSISFLNLSREEGFQPDTLAALAEHFSASHNYALGAANAICYPLRTSQFNLWQAPDNLIASIANDPLGEASQQWLLGLRNGHQAATDVPQTLLSTLTVGSLVNAGVVDTANALPLILELGLAGSANGANAILHVGKKFGRYMGLLNDDDCTPTALFNELFGVESGFFDV